MVPRLKRRMWLIRNNGRRDDGKTIGIRWQEVRYQV